MQLSFLAGVLGCSRGFPLLESRVWRRRQQHCESVAGGSRSWWHIGRDAGHYLHQGILLPTASFQYLRWNPWSLEMSSTTQLQVSLVLDEISRLLTEEDWSSPHISSLLSAFAHPRTGTGTEGSPGDQALLDPSPIHLHQPASVWPWVRSSDLTSAGGPWNQTDGHAESSAAHSAW